MRIIMIPDNTIRCILEHICALIGSSTASGFIFAETSPSVTTWESHRLQLAVSDVKYFSTCMRFSDLQLWNGYERSSHAVLQPLALHCVTHVLCDVHRKSLISSRIAIRSICLCASNGNCICLTDSHFQHSVFRNPFSVSQL